MNKEQFKGICRKTQDELKPYLLAKLRKKYDKIYLSRNYIFAKGTVPVCLVAHLDTVHKEPPRDFVEIDGKLTSPQGIGGDDRCGVYAILQIIQKHNCSVLFCCDEEIGGLGAMAFAESSLAKEAEFSYMIELDRKGKNEAVFYDCDNWEFEEFITKEEKWKTDWGTFSDICEVAPAVGCAAVNLSVGYYNQHTLKEYIVPEDVDYCIENVCKLIERTDAEEMFEYIEAEYDRFLYGFRDNVKHSGNYGERLFLIEWKDVYCKSRYKEYSANNEFEALGMFFVENPDVTYNDVYSVMDETYW